MFFPSPQLRLPYYAFVFSLTPAQRFPTHL
jgi:hypothetical protein